VHGGRVILNSELQKKDVIQKSFPLSAELFEHLKNENWQAIDQYFLKAELPGGVLFEFLKDYVKLNSLEHIIAIRSAPFDEDGIWHDDGSRILGFTISLTVHPKTIKGGEFRLRAKGAHDYLTFSTRPLGEMLIFKTGIYGFEHMVTAVTEGKRIIIAGWCS
jgi:hypothetical protein